MNYCEWRISHDFFFSFLVLFVARLLPALQAQDDSIATTGVPAIATWIPPSSPQAVPASPVNYDFAGNESERICLVLTPQTTAVVRACSSDASLQFSTNLSPSVPIDLVQTRDAGTTMCQLLIITTESGNLQEDEFEVYYNGSSVRITYGPLGLSNPNGGHLLPFSASNSEVHLLYRPPDMTMVIFKVCRNGAIADFSVNPAHPTDCRLGTGAGGFSFHFDEIVSDIGQNPLIGQNFTITSGSCDNPEAGVAFAFTVPGTVGAVAVVVAPVDTPPPPPTLPSTASMTTPISDTPTTSIVATPTVLPPTSRPGNPISTGLKTGIAVIVVLVVSCVCLFLVIILIIKFRTKKLGNCHLAFSRSISQTKDEEDTPGFVDNKGSHSPSEQRTPEPQVIEMSALIEGTEEGEVPVLANLEASHTQIDLPPSDDENSTDLAQSPASAGTPTTTPTTIPTTIPTTTPHHHSHHYHNHSHHYHNHSHHHSHHHYHSHHHHSPPPLLLTTTPTTTGQSQTIPATAGQSGATPVITVQLVTTPVTTGQSEATPNTDTKGTPPSQSSEGLPVVDNRIRDDYPDTTGSADYETDSLEKLDDSNVDVKAALTPSLSPNNKNNNHTKKRAVSAPHDPPSEKLSSITEPSAEEVLLSDHNLEGKEEAPGRVEESKSKVTHRPERISSGSVPVSRRELELKENKAIRIEKKMDQHYQGQDKTELKLDGLLNVTSKTREDIAGIRNTQEEMRDDQHSRQLEEQQDHANPIFDVC